MFQSSFPASCKRFLISLAPPSSLEWSGHICVRQGSTGDFRHQKMDGNVSAMNKYARQLPFIPPSLQQMFQFGSVFSPMVQCGSTLVYFSSHSSSLLVLSGCGNWMCAHGAACMCAKTPLKEITQAAGLRDPIVNLGADL